MNAIKVVKQIIMTLIVTYLIGLFWYRISDYYQFATDMFEIDESDTWLVATGLSRPRYESHLGEPKNNFDKLILSMYYALTTLSTVGYGDFYPKSVVEKIVGSIIQIFGVTWFSILMNGFIEVVVSLNGDTQGRSET